MLAVSAGNPEKSSAQSHVSGPPLPPSGYTGFHAACSGTRGRKMTFFRLLKHFQTGKKLCKVMTTVVQHVTAEATDQLEWSRVGPEVTKTQVDCWSFCAGYLIARVFGGRVFFCYFITFAKVSINVQSYITFRGISLEKAGMLRGHRLQYNLTTRA